MPDQSLNLVMARLQRLAAPDGSESVPDNELLRRYTAQRDSAAFELLIRRYGGMVLATCRRVLGSGPDAEDAFQATFLILVRKAHAIRRKQSLAAWLHRVALNAAMRVRKRSAQRINIEQAAARPATAQPQTPSADLGPILDQEIDRLPGRYRRAFVLCQLEGKSTEDAARMLGVAKGTIFSRVARARDRLRIRLLRRGVAPAAALVIAEESLPAATAELALANARNFVNGTITGIAPSVTALSEGVIQTMFLNKLKLTAVGLAIALSMLTAGVAFIPGPGAALRAEDKPKPPATEKAGKPAGPQAVGEPSPLDLLVPRKPLPNIHQDEYHMHGTWTVIEVIANGEHRDPGDMTIVFGPFQTMFVSDYDRLRGSKPLSFKLDPTQPDSTRPMTADAPSSIDLTSGGKTQVGIYLFETFEKRGDALRLCVNEKGNKRPSEFNADKGSGNVMFLLMRKSYDAETKWAEKLFPDGLVVDFGTITGNDPKTVRVKLKNPYPLAVHFGGSNPLAQGLTMNWAKTLGPLESGAEAAFEITLDPRNANKRTGAVREGIHYFFTVQNYRPKTDPLRIVGPPNRIAPDGQPHSSVQLTVKVDFGKPSPK